MSDRDDFPVEPWRLREVGLDPDQLARTESLFALSNGYLGVRGTLEEGEPDGLARHLSQRFLRVLRLSYPEKGYAFPEWARAWST